MNITCLGHLLYVVLRHNLKTLSWLSIYLSIIQLVWSLLVFILLDLCECIMWCCPGALLCITSSELCKLVAIRRQRRSNYQKNVPLLEKKSFSTWPSSHPCVFMLLFCTDCQMDCLFHNFPISFCRWKLYNVKNLLVVLNPSVVAVRAVSLPVAIWAAIPFLCQRKKDRCSTWNIAKSTQRWMRTLLALWPLIPHYSNIEPAKKTALCFSSVLVEEIWLFDKNIASHVFRQHLCLSVAARTLLC